MPFLGTFILFEVLFLYVVFMKLSFQDISFRDKESIAQGTIEYLVTIGVIVVLSLVVVGLVSSSFDSFSNVGSVSSRVAQSSGLISISEAVVDDSGDGLVTLGNSSGGLLIITKLSVEGVDNNYPDVSLSQGETKTFSLSEVSSGCSCAGFEGKTRTCDVIVFAESEYGLEKEFPLAVSVDCVPVVMAADPSVVVEPSGEDVSPLIFLLSPEDNNFWDYSSTVSFDFNVWDASDVNSCSLLIDGIDVNDIVPVLGLNSISYNLNDVNYLWDVNCVDEWGNSGSASSANDLSVDANAYQINNCLQLQGMNLNLDGDYVLMNDVNCYDDTHSGGALYNGGAGFEPVGPNTAGWYPPNYSFTGTFDGQGHVVSDIYINRDIYFVGLFSSTNGAVITNTGLTNVSVYGNMWVGGLVGVNTDSNITDCFVRDTNVIAHPWLGQIGALTGQNTGNATISNCYVTGTVTNTGSGTYYGSGGLAGYNTGGGVIANCYSDVNVYGEYDVGGLMGYLDSTSAISNSYFVGTATGGERWKGGLVHGKEDGATITNCGWWDGSGPAYAIGATGENVTYNEADKSVFMHAVHGVYTAGASTWDFVNVWDICEGASYPTLKWENRSC